MSGRRSECPSGTWSRFSDSSLLYTSNEGPRNRQPTCLFEKISTHGFLRLRNRGGRPAGFRASSCAVQTVEKKMGIELGAECAQLRLPQRELQPPLVRLRPAYAWRHKWRVALHEPAIDFMIVS